MSTDTDIWERALERAGVWRAGDLNLNPRHISASITPEEPHDIPAPRSATPQLQ